MGTPAARAPSDVPEPPWQSTAEASASDILLVDPSADMDVRRRRPEIQLLPSGDQDAHLQVLERLDSRPVGARAQGAGHGPEGDVDERIPRTAPPVGQRPRDARGLPVTTGIRVRRRVDLCGEPSEIRRGL